MAMALLGFFYHPAFISTFSFSRNMLGGGTLSENMEAMHVAKCCFKNPDGLEYDDENDFTVDELMKGHDSGKIAIANSFWHRGAYARPFFKDRHGVWHGLDDQNSVWS